MLTLRVTYDAAPKGNPAATTVCQPTEHVLQVSSAHLPDIVALQRVAADRGIAHAGHLAIARAKAVCRHRAIPPRFRQTEVLKAALGDISGICGFAGIIFRILCVNSGGIVWNST